MPCYTPLRASRIREADGSYTISFAYKDQLRESLMLLPCGQCIGCRLERSRQWAVRCMHEASLPADNCFVTLTFSDDNLPKDGSLQKSDLQKFFKRLRRYLESDDCRVDFPDLFERKISYYACGEYGEKFSRPHYHVCIFNLDFPDKRKVSDKGPLYESDLLSSIWSSAS